MDNKKIARELIKIAKELISKVKLNDVIDVVGGSFKGESAKITMVGKGKQKGYFVVELLTGPKKGQRLTLQESEIRNPKGRDFNKSKGNVKNKLSRDSFIIPVRHFENYGKYYADRNPKDQDGVYTIYLKTNNKFLYLTKIMGDDEDDVMRSLNDQLAKVTESKFLEFLNKNYDI